MLTRLPGAMALAVVVMLMAVPAGAQTGVASYYGPGFHGRTTASGERFNQHAATCAHRRLPFGTYVRITNLANGRVAHCRINDRGPFAGGRVIDVSKEIARRLGMIQRGTARVHIQIVR